MPRTYDPAKLDKFLSKKGWCLECESPLEISLEEDESSRASGAAAKIVIAHLRLNDRRLKSDRRTKKFRRNKRFK